MEIINLGNKIVNNYIFKNEGKYILIDTGYEDSYKAFCEKLKKHKIHLEDISYVFLTHAHDDHAGFLNELLKNSSAKVIMSKNATYGLKRGQNSFVGGCSTRLALFFCKIMELFGKGEHRFTPINEIFFDRFIFTEEIKKDEENNLTIEKIHGGKIIETRGHTCCSISLFLNNDILFCGDAAMNGLPSLYRATIWIENLKDYCESWEKIIKLKPKYIYPSHGKKFDVRDLEKYIAKVRKLKSYPLKHKN